MPKTFTVISEPGPIVAPVGAKTTLVNSSSGNLFFPNDDTATALVSLPLTERNAVLTALYAIKPGGSQSLSAGTYSLAFSSKFSMSAVLIVETKA